MIVRLESLIFGEIKFRQLQRIAIKVTFERNGQWDQRQELTEFPVHFKAATIRIAGLFKLWKLFIKSVEPTKAHN